MGKEYVIYEKDGKQTAHTDAYSPADGEKEVGRVEANSTDAALRKFKRQGGADTEGDEDEGSVHESRQPTEDQKEAELAKAREEEESKEDFEVLADSKGQPYVEGGDSDPSKAKGKAKASKAEPPPEPEESVLGTFRAKDEAEAIRMAKGEHKYPAEGPQRGAQTP